MNDPLFRVFYKRRGLLAIGAVLAVGLAFLLQNVLPKTYSVSNGVRIGRFMGVPLEMPEFTQQRLKMVGFLADAYEAAGIDLGIARDDLPRTVIVSIENDLNKTNNVDTLIFSVKGRSPEQARAMSQALSRALERVHGAKLEEAKLLREREIQGWLQGIEVTEERLERLDQKLDHLQPGVVADVALYTLGAKMQENRNLLIHMMQVRNNAILQNQNPVETFNTEAVSQVRAPERASFPRLGLLLPALLALSMFGWIALCWLEALYVSYGPVSAAQ